MADKLKHRMAQLYLALFAGVLVPGGAYFVRGKILKGILVCFAVLASFFIGLIITQNYAFTAQTLERHPVMYYLQYLVGAPSIASTYMSPHIMVTQPFVDTKFYEIGILYLAVAGLLNVLAYIHAITGIISPKKKTIKAEDNTSVEGSAILNNLKSVKSVIIYLGCFAVVITGMIVFIKSILINSYIGHFFVICAFVSVVTASLRKDKPLETGFEIVHSFLILSAGIIIFAFFLYFLQQPELIYG